MIAPVLPPYLDGIGDYSAHLSSELSEKGHNVRIWTAQDNPHTIDKVSIYKSFDYPHQRILNFKNALTPIVENPPEWIILQYNPYSYGKWGINPILVYEIAKLRLNSPSTKIAIMCHETGTLHRDIKALTIGKIQALQLWLLGKMADVVGFSTEYWTKKIQIVVPKY